MKHTELVSDFDVESLTRMTPTQLRGLWPKVTGRRAPPPAVHKRLLVRELAWLIQESRSPGGALDAETARLLNAAIRAVHEGPATAGQQTGPVARPTRRRVRTLPAAARLVREYRGTEHEVTVQDGRSFLYRGTVYRSLTAIARLITGAECSGPRFFGLTTTSQDRGGPA